MNTYSSIVKRIFLVLILCLAISCSTEEMPKDPGSDPGTEVVTSIEARILELVNVHRRQIGKPALALHPFASQLAKEHNDYMIEKGAISHDEFNDRFQKLQQEAGATGAGENVAAGQTSAESVMNAWLNSQGHKDNIEGDFTHIGISATKNANGRYYYTQIFFK